MRTLLLLLLCGAAYAQPISQLPPALPFNGSELVPMGQAGWTQATCGASYGTTSGLCTVKAPLSILLNNNAPNGIANPVFTYAAPNDTVLLNASGVFNSTAGNSTVSFAHNIGGNFQLATIVVNGCGQLTATTPVVTAGGNNYANGDTVTMSNGLVLTVTWAIGGVVQAASSSNVFPGVAVFGSGAVTSWPGGGAFTQVSTTGSGSGLTVTMTQTAAPLSTTILGSFAGGTSIPLSANCSQTITNGSHWVAWGHDDAPAIQNALNSGYATVILPGPNQVYGIRSTLVLPSSAPIIFDCQGATIVALDAMAAMVQTSTNGIVFSKPYKSKMRNCILEGMGIATVGILHGDSFWDFDVTVSDAITADVEINKVGGGGSVVLNNQLRFQTNTNTDMVPNYTQYCIWLPYTSATDNQFMPGEFWIGCQQAAVYDQTFGTFYQGPIHAYEVSNGPIFNLAGGAYNMDDLYPDNPEGSYCGLLIAGSDTRLTGWTVLTSGYNVMNQGGLCMPHGGKNKITGGVCNGSITPANCVQLPTSGSGVYSNAIDYTIGASVQNPFTPQILSFNTQANIAAGGATNYCPPGAAACSTNFGSNYMSVPRSCQLGNFYLNATGGDIGSGQTYIATLIVSGATTPIACTMTGNGSSTAGCSDTTDNYQINAGQGLVIRIQTSSASTGLRLYGALECLALH